MQKSWKSHKRPHEISDTSHFWLGQKYHKNNAASSFSALALLFPHSQPGSASQTCSRPRIHQQHQAQAPSGISFQPQALSREIFLVQKPNESFCGSQGLFLGRGVRLPLLMLPGHLQPPGTGGHTEGTAPSASDPAGWQSLEAAPGPGLLCNPSVHVSELGPYPFRPPGRVCYAEEASEEPRQTDRKPSLSPRGHIVCPGLNLNIKKTLFISFIYKSSAVCFEDKP